MGATMQLESTLLADYNYWRSQTWHTRQLRDRGYLRDHKLKKTAPAFTALGQWCGERNIDPRRWLYFRFAARNWRYAPRLDQLIPSKRTEEQTIHKYKLLKSTPAFSQRVHEESRFHQEPTGVYWDVNRDISHLAEAVKRRYIATDQLERCMSEMDSRTFGFHPKSRVCQRCPAATECLRRLQAKAPFDIVALRRGDVDLQSCYVTAQRVRG